MSSNLVALHHCCIHSHPRNKAQGGGERDKQQGTRPDKAMIGGPDNADKQDTHTRQGLDKAKAENTAPMMQSQLPWPAYFSIRGSPNWEMYFIGKLWFTCVNILHTPNVWLKKKVCSVGC